MTNVAWPAAVSADKLITLRAKGPRIVSLSSHGPESRAALQLAKLRWDADGFDARPLKGTVDPHHAHTFEPV